MSQMRPIEEANIRVCKGHTKIFYTGYLMIEKWPN